VLFCRFLPVVVFIRMFLSMWFYVIYHYHLSIMLR
jgi:hypothetical protein